jgi:hypothetical protein
MDNDQRSVCNDIARSLQTIFVRYSTTARRRGWRAITSDAGRREVDKLINNPTRSLSAFRTLTFKEWLAQEEQHVS